MRNGQLDKYVAGHRLRRMHHVKKFGKPQTVKIKGRRVKYSVLHQELLEEQADRHQLSTFEDSILSPRK